MRIQTLSAILVGFALAIVVTWLGGLAAGITDTGIIVASGEGTSIVQKSDRLPSAMSVVEKSDRLNITKKFSIPMKNGIFSTIAWVHNIPLVVALDTGANVSEISVEDAAQLGTDLVFTGQDVHVRLAVGKTVAREATLTEVRLGDIVVKDVRVLVTENGAGLLGATFFGSIRFAYEQGVLTLEQ
jgi:clan AA aspartic protease (TIGR02281 family)